MMGIQPSTEQPFWKDEANPFAPPQSSGAKFTARIMLGVVIAVRLIELATLLGIAVFFAVKFPIVWLILVPTLGLMAYTLLRALWRSRRTRRQLPAAEIQRLARERTGADVIGSALHTAGHPLLTVNQPVVLALRGQELSLYSYSSPHPIDVMNVGDIQDVRTVVIDDGGAPHTNVVSSTAQALQLTFLFRGSPFTCSFRRMYKVRAIGWYQAIQADRASGSS